MYGQMTSPEDTTSRETRQPNNYRDVTTQISFVTENQNLSAFARELGVNRTILFRDIKALVISGGGNIHQGCG